ncbi:MAG: DNA repair protein RadC [Pseudomonadota bacterium]
MAKRSGRMSELEEAPLPGLATLLPPKAAPPPPDHANHRERLRARFMAGGSAAIADYELLELVLFRAIPRRDVKPLAKALLRQFGDFNRVISAAPARLTEVQGIGSAVVQELKIVEAAARRLSQVQMLGADAISSWGALIDYCRVALAHQDREVFHALFLDRKNKIIADEEQGRGTVDHVPVYPREVAKRALELNASALILVHNHPSGDPTPSEADIAVTDQIRSALDALGIVLHDHVIVGKGSETSFRGLGLL